MQNQNDLFDDLLLSYFSGEISEKDQHILSEMLKADEAHRKRYAEMAKMYALAYDPFFEASKETNYRQLIKRIDIQQEDSFNRHWLKTFSKVAAVILFVLSFSTASYYLYKDVVESKDKSLCFETIIPSGSQTKIILPDGSIVWLNSGSIFKYDRQFGKKAREVYLTGEGFFEVKKNPKSPFFVHTQQLDVKVLGTTFNVKSYDKDSSVQIDLVEGLVDITLPDRKKDVLKLHPNEKMIYNKLTKKMYLYKTDTSRATLWTTGKLCFVDASLVEIMKDLERNYNVKIIITSDALKNELFSGSLNLNLPLDEILSYIDVDNKFIVNHQGNIIKISTKLKK